MTVFESPHRFLRPADLGRTRRNHRRLQAQRVLAVCANVVLVGVLIVAGYWLYRKTQEDTRFAVKRIEITGVRHCPRAQVEQVARVYRGTNLFRLDLGGVRTAFAALPWIQRVAVEKKLPDTLLVRVFERSPVALTARGRSIRYVDREGVIFAELSPEVGNPDLPLITGASRQPEIAACVRFLRDLAAVDAPLYSRLSEIAPVEGGGFRLYDRSLGTYVLVGEAGARERWRLLHGLLAAEHVPVASLEYADLRFRDRVVLKPRIELPVLSATGTVAMVPALGAAIASSRD